MRVGLASPKKVHKHPSLISQLLENFILIFLNPSFDLAQRVQLSAYLLIAKQRHWSIRLVKYTMILLELVRHRNWYFAAHVILYQVLEECQLFTYRSKTEKFFWSFLFADGLVAGTSVVFWNAFCRFIVGYLVASHVFFEHKIIQAILQNLIFVGFNLYLLIVHWHYVLFLLKYKLPMIAGISVLIVVGIASVNRAKRDHSIRLTITRKYFHLLALLLFLPMIIYEVR
jgi:hypothetical protein